MLRMKWQDLHNSVCGEKENDHTWEKCVFFSIEPLGSSYCSDVREIY